MSKQIQRRRGSNNDHAAFVGAQGEFTYNTDTKRIVAHDGLTAGGFPAMRVDELGATSGSALVGYDGQTVQDVLDGAKSLQDYAALRAYTGRATSVRILATGIAGFFYYDNTDTSSADNGGTIIVSSNGRRWKRLFDGPVSVKWFGATGLGVINDSSAIQYAVNSHPGEVIEFPKGRYLAWGLHDVIGGTYFHGQGEGSEIIAPGGVDIITINNERSGVHKLSFSVTTATVGGTTILINGGANSYYVTRNKLRGFFANPYSGSGVKLAGAKCGTVSGNDIRYHAKAIECVFAFSSGANANLIQNNQISLNIKGITINGGDTSDTFVGNIIQGNEVGIDVGTGINYVLALTGNYLENNIGASPIDIRIACGGGSVVTLTGNQYYAFSDNASVLPVNLLIETGTEAIIHSVGEKLGKIVNYSSSGQFIKNSGLIRDILYHAPNNPASSFRTVASAVPTGGTWQKGTFIENSTPENRSNVGWVCVKSGTLANITATGTLSTDGSTGAVTGVTNATSFTRGQYVYVSAGFPTTGPYKIMKIYGSTLELDTNSNSVQSGVVLKIDSSVFPVFAESTSHTFGNFTGSVVGFETAPTPTLTYQLTGKSVSLFIPTISGISNASTFTISGLPSVIVPVGLRQLIGASVNNGGTKGACHISISNTGIITIEPPFGTAAFAASGVKTFAQNTVNYMIE